jgi:hypothetical protein
MVTILGIWLWKMRRWLHIIRHRCTMVNFLLEAATFKTVRRHLLILPVLYLWSMILWWATSPVLARPWLPHLENAAGKNKVVTQTGCRTKEEQCGYWHMSLGHIFWVSALCLYSHWFPTFGINWLSAMLFMELEPTLIVHFRKQNKRINQKLRQFWWEQILYLGNLRAGNEEYVTSLTMPAPTH